MKYIRYAIITILFGFFLYFFIIIFNWLLVIYKDGFEEIPINKTTNNIVKLGNVLSNSFQDSLQLIKHYKSQNKEYAEFIFCEKYNLFIWEIKGDSTDIKCIRIIDVPKSTFRQTDDGSYKFYSNNFELRFKVAAINNFRKTLYIKRHLRTLNFKVNDNGWYYVITNISAPILIGSSHSSNELLIDFDSVDPSNISIAIVPSYLSFKIIGINNLYKQDPIPRDIFNSILNMKIKRKI